MSCPHRTSGTRTGCLKVIASTSRPASSILFANCRLVLGLNFGGKKYDIPGLRRNWRPAATKLQSLSGLTAAARFRFGSTGSMTTRSTFESLAFGEKIASGLAVSISVPLGQDEARLSVALKDC